MSSRPQVLTQQYFFGCMCFVFLIAMHYMQPHIGGWGLSLPNNALTWMGIAAAIGLSLFYISQRLKLRYSKFLVVFGISFLLMLVPLLYPNEYVAAESYPRLIGFLAGGLFYLSLHQLAVSKKDLNRILQLVLVGIAFQAVFGLLQLYYFEGEVFSGFNLVTGTPGGVYQQPNVMASLLVTGLGLGFYLFPGAIKFWAVFISLYTAVAIWLLWHLESRIGYISLLLVCLLMVADIIINKRFRSCGLLLIIVIVLFGAQQMNNSDRRLDNLDAISKVSARTSIYSTSLQMIAKKPLAGWGYGSMYPAFTDYYGKRQLVEEGLSAKIDELYHPHNEILLWWIEGGVIPVLGLLLIAGAFFRLLFQNKQNKILLFALVLPFVLHSMVEYPFYHSAIHWVIFLILVYVADTHEIKELVIERGRTAFIGSAFIITIVSSIFILSSLYTLSQLQRYELQRLMSGSANPSALMRVLNPVPYTNIIDRTVNVYMLQYAMATGNISRADDYIAWAEPYVKYYPNQVVLQGLEVAYLIKGNQVKADSWRRQLFEYYPKDPGLIQNPFLVKRVHREKTVSVGAQTSGSN